MQGYWRPEEIRASILAICCISSVGVILHDLLEGRLTDFYVGEFVKTSLPFVAAGIFGGRYAASRVNPARFRQIVLVCCAIMGTRLLFG